MPVEMPLGGACMREAGEIRHVPDSVKSSPLSHGHPALMGEGKRWKGKLQKMKFRCYFAQGHRGRCVGRVDTLADLVC